MTNMSYCRFQNTLADLQDCYGTLIEIREAGGLEYIESRYEDLREEIGALDDKIAADEKSWPDEDDLERMKRLCAEADRLEDLLLTGRELRACNELIELCRNVVELDATAELF